VARCSATTLSLLVVHQDTSVVAAREPFAGSAVILAAGNLAEVAQLKAVAVVGSASVDCAEFHYSSWQSILLLLVLCLMVRTVPSGPFVFRLHLGVMDYLSI